MSAIAKRAAGCSNADDALQYDEDPQHTKKQKKKKQPKNMQLQLQSPPKPADPCQASRSSSSHCINNAQPIAKPADPPIGVVTVMDGCMSPIMPEIEFDMHPSPITPETEVDMRLSPITPEDEVEWCLLPITPETAVEGCR